MSVFLVFSYYLGKLKEQVVCFDSSLVVVFHLSLYVYLNVACMTTINFLFKILKGQDVVTQECAQPRVCYVDYRFHIFLVALSNQCMTLELTDLT